MQVVQQRNAATLLPIIQAHVAPGTIIHSDEWRAYSRVARLPPVAARGTVNYSVTFVDPVTGVHTQNAESYWNRVKTRSRGSVPQDQRYVRMQTRSHATAVGCKGTGYVAVCISVQQK